MPMRGNVTKEKAKYIAIIAIEVHTEFIPLSQENMKGLATGP